MAHTLAHTRSINDIWSRKWVEVKVKPFWTQSAQMISIWHVARTEAQLTSLTSNQSLLKAQLRITSARTKSLAHPSSQIRAAKTYKHLSRPRTSTADSTTYPQWCHTMGLSSVLPSSNLTISPSNKSALSTAVLYSSSRTRPTTMCVPFKALRPSSPSHSTCHSSLNEGP